MSQIPGMPCEELNLLTCIAHRRTEELIAIGRFQMIPDIGPVVAECLVPLGYSHPIQLKGKDPARLLDTFEERSRFWVLYFQRDFETSCSFDGTSMPAGIQLVGLSGKMITSWMWQKACKRLLAVGDDCRR